MMFMGGYAGPSFSLWFNLGSALSALFSGASQGGAR